MKFEVTVQKSNNLNNRFQALVASQRQYPFLISKTTNNKCKIYLIIYEIATIFNKY